MDIILNVSNRETWRTKLNQEQIRKQEDFCQRCDQINIKAKLVSLIQFLSGLKENKQVCNQFVLFKLVLNHQTEKQSRLLCFHVSCVLSASDQTHLPLQHASQQPAVGGDAQWRGGGWRRGGGGAAHKAKNTEGR